MYSFLPWKCHMKWCADEVLRVCPFVSSRPNPWPSQSSHHSPIRLWSKILADSLGQSEAEPTTSFFFSLGQALWLAGSGPLPVKVPNPNHRISREVPWTYHFLTPRRVNWRVKNKAGSQPGIFIPSTNVYRALTVCQAHYVLDVGNEKGVGGKSWHYDSAALWFQKSVWTSVTHDTLWNRKFRMYTVDLVISLPDIWSSKTLAWVQRELCVRLTLKHYF